MDKDHLVVLVMLLCMYFGTVAACGNRKKCNPADKKPCRDCFFCKKNKKEKHVCFKVREQTVVTIDDLKAIIRNFESYTLTMTDVNPKPKVFDPTIGYGFSLKRGDAKATFNKVLPGVNFDKVLSGKKAITWEQAKKLFHHDIDNIYIPRAERKIGKKLFGGLTMNVKTAIVNAFYRGDIGPKTIALIKQEKWAEAAVEYLNHNGYKNAKKNGMSGIIPRMKCNAEQFKKVNKPPPPKKKCKEE
ncbi:uncharacterized protein LOC128558779 [Mercenaria mercenaria]|uniref:uncharacterized protein LOC128558779 n=1 Tax=Mercenaria mercenaria TaxID=6596 RepID=UPI00234F73B3|nr:uncharacterized protein LOC128558779 [Mercenaria mercenaria]